MKYINQLIHFNVRDIFFILGFLFYWNRKKVIRFFKIFLGKTNRISKTHVGNMGDAYYHEKLDKFIVKWTRERLP